MAEFGIVYSPLQLANLKSALAILAAAVSGVDTENSLAALLTEPVAKSAETTALPDESLVPAITVTADVLADKAIMRVSELEQMPDVGQIASVNVVTAAVNQVTSPTDELFGLITHKDDSKSPSGLTAAMFFENLPWQDGHIPLSDTNLSTVINQLSGDYFPKLPWHNHPIGAAAEASAFLGSEDVDLSMLAALATQTAIQAAQQHAKKPTTASSGARRFFSTLPW